MTESSKINNTYKHYKIILEKYRDKIIKYIYGKIDSIISSDREKTGDDRCFWFYWTLFFVLSLFTRLIYINFPNYVIWDETHFGKMMGWYLNGTFFFDVHPPGGKLLITLFGYAGGYNATHSFEKPGVSYEGFEGILATRVGCATLGALIVPFGFSSVWRLTKSLTSAILAASFLTFEIGTILLSKYIILDPILFCFIMATFHGFTLISFYTNREYSFKWWISMIYTGCMIGCVMSVKFVGVFMVCVVGLYTLKDLWEKFGNTEKSLINFCFDLVARALCLICLPFAIYVLIFSVHDTILYTQHMPNDNGAGYFSPNFQMNLENSYLHNLTQSQELYYGNIVTIKNPKLGGVYLHSHNHSYENTNITQVTGYRGKDVYNLFQVLYTDYDRDDGLYYSGDLDPVRNGDWVRLIHIMLNNTVACSRNASVITTKHKMVYAKKPGEAALDEGKIKLHDEYKDEKNIFELWKIELIDKDLEDDSIILPFASKFRLVSPVFGCVLTTSRKFNENLWGQDEITCTRNKQDPYSIWMFEKNFNWHDKNMTNFSHLKSNFLERIFESHQMMSHINSKMTPTPEEMVTSHKPWMWPIMYKGQCWLEIEDFRFTLLGNPVVFYLNLIFLIVAPFILVKRNVKKIREPTLDENIEKSEESLYFAVKWLLIAYLFHYLPFFGMNRILYYHHYFPALMFSSMLTAVIIGHLINQLRESKDEYKVKLSGRIFICVMILVITGFLTYCKTGFGFEYMGGNSTYSYLRLWKNWEI